MKQILKYLFFLLIGIIIFLLYNGKDGFSIGGVRVKITLADGSEIYGNTIGTPYDMEHIIVMDVNLDGGGIGTYDTRNMVTTEPPATRQAPTQAPTHTPTPTPGTSQFNIGDRVSINSRNLPIGTIGTITGMQEDTMLNTGINMYNVLTNDGQVVLLYEDFLEPAPADEPAPIPEDVPPAPIPEDVPPAPAEPAPAPARRVRDWFGCASGGGGKHYM